MVKNSSNEYLVTLLTGDEGNLRHVGPKNKMLHETEGQSYIVRIRSELLFCFTFISVQSIY